MKNAHRLNLSRIIVIAAVAWLSPAARAQVTSLTLDFNDSNPFANSSPPTMAVIDAGGAGWGSVPAPTQVDPAGANNDAMWSQSSGSDNGSHIILDGMRDPTHSDGMDINGANNLSVEVSTYFKFDFSAPVTAYRANFDLANSPTYPIFSQGGPLGVFEGQVRMYSPGDWGLSYGSTDVHIANPLLEDTWYRTDLKLTYADDNDLAVSLQLFDLSGNLLGSMDLGSEPLGQSKGCWYALWQDNSSGVGGVSAGETSTTYFDDVTLTGAPNAVLVPEPVSFNLVAGLAVLVLGACRRTRRLS